jgi:CBS domain-containing protein
VGRRCHFRACYAPPMAALDPVAFLRATRPFNDLPPDLFRRAARALDIGFFAAGKRLVERGGTPLQHLYIIRKGAVRLEREGQTLQLLEEGEIFGYTSLLSKKATLDAIVEEDLLAYRIPAAEFQELLADARFASHFATGLAERLKHSLERSQIATFQTDLGVAIETRATRKPVRVPGHTTVGEAARVMRDNGVSSVLVDTDPVGIVTDRDFRNRVLAAGLGPETPVTAIYSAPVKTIPGHTAMYEAWQMLLDMGVHHLPITRGGEIVGVLTSSDLLKTTAQGPVTVLRSVERLPSRDALPGYGARVSEMASSLLAGGLDATVIAGFVARLNDALLGRILRWAEADLGMPPAPYAWIAFGSEGRMEQTLLTDQDNALVHGGGDADEGYFAALAERTNADLEAAGFPRCPGGYMARNHHGSLEMWERRFSRWLDEPKPDALLNAAIFFDFRKVHGTLDLAPLESALQRTSKERVFLACMAKAALQFSPPSLLMRVRGGEIDLKLQGISPIVFLARPYALEVGSLARNTLDRLDAAVEGGLIGSDSRATLREAYRFLLGLRLREQLHMVAEGKPPVNTIALSALTSIERSRLKDSLRAVRNWQEKASYHYRTDLF